jgi:hypothetical protein
MKFLNIFLFLWVTFALLDPDPDSESESTDLIESGSNNTGTHWYKNGGNFVRFQAFENFEWIGFKAINAAM